MSIKSCSDLTLLEFAHGFPSNTNSQRLRVVSSRTAIVRLAWSKRRRRAETRGSGKAKSLTQLEPERARREKTLAVVRCSRMNSFLGVKPVSAGELVKDGMCVSALTATGYDLAVEYQKHVVP